MQSRRGARTNVTRTRTCMLGPGQLINNGTVVLDVGRFGQCAAGQAQLGKVIWRYERENGCGRHKHRFARICEVPIIEGKEGKGECRALSSAVCSAVGARWRCTGVGMCRSLTSVAQVCNRLGRRGEEEMVDVGEDAGAVRALDLRDALL